MLMKAIGVTTALAALAIGSHMTGLVNLKTLPAEMEQLVTGDQRHIIVGVDITEGRENEIPKDYKAVQKLIAGLKTGDAVEIYLIDSKSESYQEAIFSAKMPDDDGPMETAIRKAQKDAQNAISECWDDSINKALTDKHLVQQTDLFGFFRFASRKTDFRSSTKPVLILFTDGQEVGDSFNFEKKIPDSHDLTKVKNNDLLPDLKGVIVMISGYTPTHNISNEHWRKLQVWWRDYLKEAGAKAISISSERDMAASDTCL